ncbi:hypothetical protein BJY04DRAFT_217169 [Aspergillus karnatakaensis]|uniref:uncharacterized protein n=1 Tax=Aspergillus karnatakaensis TaxID=1810916 RepID=UPI003CCDC2DF
MTRERRKWTAEEDTLLQNAVQAAIANSRPLLWREISKAIPTRSNKDCRRRWCNSLSTSLNKGPWTETEDERLWNAVQKHGPRWSLVSSEVGSRNADQCASHWGQTLNPEIDFGDWSAGEDEKLKMSVERHGTNWSTIASLYFPKRTSLALRNRFNALDARGREGQSQKRKSTIRVAKRIKSSRSSPLRKNGLPSGRYPTIQKDDEDGEPGGNYNYQYDRHEKDYDNEEYEDSSSGSSVDRYEDSILSVTNGSGVNSSTDTASDPASFSFSQSPLHDPIPYLVPELNFPNDLTCWDSMMELTGLETTLGPLQDLDITACNASFPYSSPTADTEPLESDQSMLATHRISIDVECTSQQLPEIMSSVIAIGGRVTMRLNHECPDSGG